MSETQAPAPYALIWTERQMKLAWRRLETSQRPTMTLFDFTRWAHSCTAIPSSAGEFIIFGGKIKPPGKSTTVFTNDVILLSTTDMSFTTLEPCGTQPKNKAWHRAVIVGRVLVVFGGTVDDSYLHFLNLDTREWSNLRPPAPYPRSRYGHSFTIIDNTIWLYGGDLLGAILDDMWSIDLESKSIQRARWQQVPQKAPWPGARSHHSAVCSKGCLYIFGGRGIGRDGEQDPYFNDVWKFEVPTKSWTKLQCHGLVPDPRECHSVAVIGENMFIFGGHILGSKEGKKVPTDDAFVFNLQDHTWRSLAMLGRCPETALNGVLLTLDSQLILVGGHDKRNVIHIADVQGAEYAPDSLARLQFTTETTNLKFTTEVVDLSRFVRKQGNSAYALAGFSDVWKGEMTETGQPIAIKVLRVTNTGDLDDPESSRLRTRFDRELTIWKECQHPRVLELLGHAYIEGVPCLISPWCANGNVLEFLSKNPGVDRRRLISQVAEGLVYLHGRDPPVTHSDIKPANILVSDEGNAKICDFGISKLMLECPSGFTTTATVKGTLRYSSPEMLDSDGRTTTNSDVWAFGMSILHVMTNKIPYVQILSEPKLIMTIAGGKVPSPEDYPDLPATDPLWGVMRECWTQDPTKRPTMAQVMEKLLIPTATYVF